MKSMPTAMIAKTPGDISISSMPKKRVKKEWSEKREKGQGSGEEWNTKEKERERR